MIKHEVDGDKLRLIISSPVDVSTFVDDLSSYLKDSVFSLDGFKECRLSSKFFFMAILQIQINKDVLI